jgi:hypothetical protein
VPSQDRVGRHDGRDLGEERAAEFDAANGEAPSFVFGETQPALGKAGSKDPVFFTEVLDRGRLPTVEPACDRQGEEVDGARRRIHRTETVDFAMPEISRFFGIVIKMYFNDHAPPHFHAEYGDEEAVLSIESLAVLRGSLPSRAIGLVLEWAQGNRKALFENWDSLRGGEPPRRIKPLE